MDPALIPPLLTALAAVLTSTAALVSLFRNRPQSANPFLKKLAIYFTQVTPTCCGPGLRQTRGAIGVQWSSETRRPRCIQRPPEGRPSSSAGVSSVVGAGPWPGRERAGAGLDGDRNILGLPE